MQVYKITNLATGLSYVGKDQTDNCKYMGSGILLWNSYRKRFGRDDLDMNKFGYTNKVIPTFYKEIRL